MEKKQSSIDWLKDKLNGVDTGVSHHYFNSIIQEAKAMHKEEIVESYREGRSDQQSKEIFYHRNSEQYYNEKLGGNNE